MININFYMKVHELKKQILLGKKFDKEELLQNSNHIEAKSQ